MAQWFLHFFFFFYAASDALFPIEGGEGADGKEEENKGDDVTPRAEGDNWGPGADKQETDTVPALLLHGGMDTEGEIFDDTLIFLLE